jgi:hypothetical protein
MLGLSWTAVVNMDLVIKANLEVAGWAPRTK